jgi:hypothetical protein
MTAAGGERREGEMRLFQARAFQQYKEEKDAVIATVTIRTICALCIGTAAIKTVVLECIAQRRASEL